MSGVRKEMQIKLQNDNCKLQLGRRQLEQFAICILQFAICAICNILPAPVVAGLRCIQKMLRKNRDPVPLQCKQ
jgi:hypothetical protein